MAGCQKRRFRFSPTIALRRISGGKSSLCALTLAVAGALGLGSGVPAHTQTVKTDRFLARTLTSPSSAGWSSVIIQLDGDPTPEREAALKALGADVYRHLHVIRSLAVRVPTKNLSRLAALPFVRHLSSDTTVKKCDAFTVGSSEADVAYQKYNLTGSGVGVAVLDSGVRTLQDLCKPGLLGTFLLSSTRVVQSVNFVPGSTTTDDLCGHGTHVAGIIAGNGASSSGLTTYRTFYGIARQANLVNVRVLDTQGQASVSTVLAGIQWIITNRSTYNIRVLNMSMGHPVGESYTTDPLCQAVEQAWKAGIVVVCAAGNNGRIQNTVDPSLDNEGYGTAYGSIESPGNDPYVITVGATKSMDGNRADDRIATYSSRGPGRVDLVLKPDIIAPGNRVISTLAAGSYLDTTYSSTNQVPWQYYRLSLGGNSNAYFTLSGTSMATPVVAGAAAMLLQKYPNLSPDTIKARLMVSADKWTDPMGNADPCTYGAGYLNIPAALQSTVVATQPAMSPTLSEDSSGNVYINIDGSLWSTRAIWGTGITDLRAIWGTRAIWGVSTDLLESSRAIWGTSVWSDRAIWGVNTSQADLSTTAIAGE